MRPVYERTLWLANPFMLSPAVGCLLLFFVIPMIATIVVSFTDWQLGGQGDVHFIGLQNYIDLWASSDFRKSVSNTFFMTAIVVPTSFLLSLALALAVRASGKLAQTWQTIYFLPVTASLVAMAVVWQWILHPEVGFVAVILTHFGVTQNVNLLNDPDYVLWTLSFITVWQMAGYFMVLFLTGLVQIPKELYDAAKVDGANNPMALFAHITWPLLGRRHFSSSFSRSSRHFRSLTSSRCSREAVRKKPVKFCSTRCIRKAFPSFEWEQPQLLPPCISRSCFS